jgi:hypothetical protein
MCSVEQGSCTYSLFPQAAPCWTPISNTTTALVLTVALPASLCMHTLLQQVGVKAKDLIKKLLVIDRTKRLGCIKGGGRAVREHKWFDGLDWDALYEGKLEVH